MDWNIDASHTREEYYRLLLKMVSVVSRKGLRMIIENPWNVSGETYLQRNFLKPTIIDHNRAIRGDYFVKPTAYWFVNCTNTFGYSEQRNTQPKIVYKSGTGKGKKGVCNEGRSIISPDYARNFICDFILGKEQEGTQLSIF